MSEYSVKYIVNNKIAESVVISRDGSPVLSLSIGESIRLYFLLSSVFDAILTGAVEKIDVSDYGEGEN